MQQMAAWGSDENGLEFTDRGNFSGLKQCDPRPLSIAQFVAIRGHPERRDPNTEFYEPLKVVVGIPECRYGLALGPKYACHVSE